MTRRFVRFRRTYLRQISDKSAGLRLVKIWHTHVLTDRGRVVGQKVRLDHYSIDTSRAGRPAENRQFPTFSIIKVAQIATRQKHIRYLEIASRQKLY